MNEELYKEARATEPKRPVGNREIEVEVVGKRCVYVDNYRIAGGKPYVSEGLPSYTLKTRLRDVLEAFSEADILAVLAEDKAWREHWRAYHEKKAKAA